MPDPSVGGGGAAASLLEPIEHLAGRIDLVLMLALWENRQLVQVFGEPRRFFRQMHKAILDHRGLRVHAHDLIGLRLVAGDRVQTLGHQLLDQLGAGRLVFDQRDIRCEGRALLADRAFSSGYSMRLRSTCKR